MGGGSTTMGNRVARERKREGMREREREGRKRERGGVVKDVKLGIEMSPYFYGCLVSAEVVIDNGEIATCRVVDLQHSIDNVLTQTQIPLPCNREREQTNEHSVADTEPQPSTNLVSQASCISVSLPLL